METAELRSFGDRYNALRGLLLIPGGLLQIALGFGNQYRGDVAQNLVLAGVVTASLGYLLGIRYYRRTFGEVHRRTRSLLREGMFAAVAVAGVLASGIVDIQFDLSVSTMGVTWAVLGLLYYRSVASVKTYHWVILGALAAVSLAPVWGGLEYKTPVTMLVTGLAMMAIGPFDHLELLSTFRRVRSGMADVDA